MTKDFTTALNDNICSFCHCKVWPFLHNVYYEGKIQKLCTSCVLLNLNQSYCPFCFGVHESASTDMICCNNCKSDSHTTCIGPNCITAGAVSECPSCANPGRLIFYLKELRKIGENGHCKLMDKHAMTLLFTAAKIAKITISERYEVLRKLTEEKAIEVAKNRKQIKDMLAGTLLKVNEKPH